MTNVLPRQRAPGILRETARTVPSVRCRRKATRSLPAAPDYAGRRLGTAADRNALGNVAARGEAEEQPTVRPKPGPRRIVIADQRRRG